LLDPIQPFPFTVGVLGFPFRPPCAARIDMTGMIYAYQCHDKAQLKPLYLHAGRHDLQLKWQHLGCPIKWGSSGRQDPRYLELRTRFKVDIAIAMHRATPNVNGGVVLNQQRVWVIHCLGDQVGNSDAVSCSELICWIVAKRIP
jgi:hypothetical protein